jgi:tetratricopeptide (TPR) repeat protein
MFFGGFYLGTDYLPDVDRRFLLDRALALWTHAATEHAALLADPLCADPTAPALDPTYAQLLSLFCQRFDAFAAVPAGSPAPDLAPCDQLDVDAAVPCLGLLMLQGVICHSPAFGAPPGTPPGCRPKATYAATFTAIHQAYDGRLQFRGPDELRDWMLPVEYLFRADLLDTPPDVQDQFVRYALLSVVGQSDLALGRDLLQQHLAYLDAEGATARQIFFRQLLWNFAVFAGDEQSAAIGAQLRTLLDHADPAIRSALEFESANALNEGLVTHLNALGCDVPAALLARAAAAAAFDGDQVLKLSLVDGIAYAHLCSKLGDPAAALAAAAAAVELTPSAEAPSAEAANVEERLRRLFVLALANFKAGRYEDAHAGAAELVELSAANGVTLDTATQLTVSGDPVSLVALLDLAAPANVVTAIADSLAVHVRRGDDAFVRRQLDQALALAAQDLSLEAVTWNALCWWGALYGRAEAVAVPVTGACDMAVALANADELPGFRESRGLARALTNDTAGAIEDFQFFVDHQPASRLSAQRQVWLDRLHAGEPPAAIFDAATLAALRLD